MAEVAFQMARLASQLIDLQTHHGEHPRVRATDVMPFVPIRDVGMYAGLCAVGSHGGGNGSATNSKFPSSFTNRRRASLSGKQLEWIRKGG